MNLGHDYTQFEHRRLQLKSRCILMIDARIVGQKIISLIFLIQVNPQRQFIIVCGNINFDSVNGFLKDFFHPARDDTNTEVVFLNKNEPDLMFDGLLKREKTRVSYFCVSSAGFTLVLFSFFKRSLIKISMRIPPFGLPTQY